MECHTSFSKMILNNRSWQGHAGRSAATPATLCKRNSMDKAVKAKMRGGALANESASPFALLWIRLRDRRRKNLSEGLCRSNRFLNAIAAGSDFGRKYRNRQMLV